MMELALRRNLSKWQPMSFVVVGLVITVALIAAIPLFTNAALDRFLRSELACAEGRTPSLQPAPSCTECPSLARLRSNSTGEPMTFMRQRAAELPGLPLTRMTRYGSTRVLKFLAAVDKELPEDLRQSQSAGLAFLTGLEDHVEIVLGEPFGQLDPAAGGGTVIQALVSERFYYDHDIRVGDHFLFGLDDPNVVAPVEVSVKGVWRPADADRGFWFEGGRRVRFLLHRIRTGLHDPRGADPGRPGAQVRLVSALRRHGDQGRQSGPHVGGYLPHSGKNLGHPCPKST